MKRDELSPPPTTPSALEDSARKVLEATAAKVITQARSMQTARFKDAGMLG